MHQVKIKYSFHKVMLCLIAIFFTLSITPIPKASAAENYFYASGSTITLDELGPDDERVVTVTLKAAREMDLHNISGHFTPTTEDDTELELVPITGIKAYGTNIYCSWEDDGYFGWNTEDCHSEFHGYADDIHLNAGDPIFEATYSIKPDVSLAIRSLPITIDAAVVNDGGEITVSDITLNAKVYVYPADDYHLITVYKEGNGSVITPTVVLPNEEVEIKIIPDEHNELLYLTFNGQELTNQAIENNTIKMNVTESIDIYAIFQPVYDVIEGNGGKFIVGSSDDYIFKIDADLTNFDGSGLIYIDDEPIDLMHDREVDEENGKIILLNSYLTTLEKGKHTFEAIFSYPDRGSARAVFYITDKDDEPTDELTDDESGLPVPDTGSMTNSEEHHPKPISSPPLFALIGVIAAVGFLLRKQINNLRK